MTTTATTNTESTNTPNGNGSSPNGKAPRQAPTAIEAITKIGKILEQLSPVDRKRVLAFVSEGVEQ